MDELTQRFQHVMKVARRLGRGLDLVESGMIYPDDVLRAELVNNAADLKELLPELRAIQKAAIEWNDPEGESQAVEIIAAIENTSARVGRIERAAEVQETVH